MNEKTKERFYEELSQIDQPSQASWAMDQSRIQDSFCFRALQEARQIAEQLVDEKGQFKQTIFKRHMAVYERGYSDDVFRQHQQRFLHRWQSEPLFIQKFRRFSLPLCQPFAGEVIRWTLDLTADTQLKDFHIKRAVLTACLTPLRQSIGSCFATAPAIEIQKSHIDLFIDDLYELLSRGRLRRVVGGVEYAAPFCLSMGVGDLKKVIDPRYPYFASPGLIRAFEVGGKISKSLSFIDKVHQAEKLCMLYFREGMTVKDLILKAADETACQTFKNVAENALLKIWEFTIASYCDIKMENSKWSLGWCVGLSPQERGGIGMALLQALEEQLQKNHSNVEKRYQETVIALEQLRATEALMQNANSIEDLRRLKAEGIAKAHHLRVCQDLYQEEQQKEKITAEMLKKLIEQYTQKIQIYFQEIYDPEFTNESAEQYEDRFAGFRLVYKHGRSESALWTAIQDQHQFVSALDDFFRSVEPLIIDLCQDPYEKQLVSDMTTIILHHLHTPEFIESTMVRAKKLGRLPWAYSAGGSVEQIASLYFRRSSPLHAEQRSIQDELDLFTFIIETMKGLPPSITHPFIEDPSRGLLLQSPTHVCLLQPGEPLFQEAWNDRGLTYTWIRDQWINPAKEFYLSQNLSKDQQKELYRRLRTEGELKTSMSLQEFAKQIRHLSMDELGSFLFQTLPLIPAEKCQALLHSIQLPPFLSSNELFQLLYKITPSSSAVAIREQMRKLKFAPSVFLFADTNWPSGYFSFVLHPITLNLEVWKTDRAGVSGAPLPLIKSWLGKDAWSIFWS